MPSLTSYQPIVALVSTTIANTATTSAAVDLQGATLCGIHLPAAFTGTSISFSVAAASGGTYQTLQRNGSDYSVTVAQGKYVSLDPAIFAGVQFLKIISGSAEAADRTLNLAVRPV